MYGLSVYTLCQCKKNKKINKKKKSEAAVLKGNYIVKGKSMLKVSVMEEKGAERWSWRRHKKIFQIERKRH